MLTVNKLLPGGRGLAAALVRRAPKVELDWDVRQKSRFDCTDSGGRRLGVRLGRSRRGSGGSGTLGGTRLGGGEALTELLVLLVQAAQFDDHLVEEVVDLVLVVALPELRRLEALVDHIFRS